MADDAKTEPENEPDDMEEKFWAKLKAAVGEIVDDRLAAQNKAPAVKSDTGTTRTGAEQPTLKSIFASLVYGDKK